MWMKEKAETCGLEFNEGFIKNELTPDIMGRLHKSYTIGYRLLRQYLRPIGKGENTNESVHDLAVYRYKNLASYKPKNLDKYLKDIQY